MGAFTDFDVWKLQRLGALVHLMSFVLLCVVHTYIVWNLYCVVSISCTV